MALGSMKTVKSLFLTMLEIQVSELPGQFVVLGQRTVQYRVMHYGSNSWRNPTKHEKKATIKSQLDRLGRSGLTCQTIYHCTLLAAQPKLRTKPTSSAWWTCNFNVGINKIQSLFSRSKFWLKYLIMASWSQVIMEKEPSCDILYWGGICEGFVNVLA